MGRLPRWAEEMEKKRKQRRLRQSKSQPTPQPHRVVREFVPTLPSESIPHPPGSRERIEEMQRRVSRCEELWHPDDCDSFEGCVGGPKPSEPPAVKTRIARTEAQQFEDPQRFFFPRTSQTIEDTTK